MIGVLELISQYKEVVDWDKKAKSLSKKESKSVEDIKQEWEDSRNLGIEVEKQLVEKELIINPNIKVYTYTKESTDDNVIDNRIEVNQTYINRPFTIPKYNVIGRPDKVVVDKFNIDIYERKTHKELHRQSTRQLENGVKVIPKMFFSPISHLDDCNYIQANLQVSLYAYLIQINNPDFKIRKLFIEHLNHNGVKYTESKFYEVPYLKKEVRDLLKLI